MSSAGSRAVMSRLSIAGRRDVPTGMPRSRPSSSGSRSMSSSRRRPRGRRAPSRRHRHPDRLCGGRGPGRHAVGRQPGAAGRQRHRPVNSADRSRRQAARTVARGRSRVSRRLAILVNGGIPPPSWRWTRFRRRRARSASKLSRSKSGAPRNRARLRGAQGPRGGALCLRRSAHDHQPRSHQHAGARRAAADDVRHRANMSKQAV